VGKGAGQLLVAASSAVSRSHIGEQRRAKADLNIKNLDFYEGTGRLVSDYTIEIKGARIRGGHIFIASGSRPLIPPIRGLDGVDYLTNETVLQLKERPESMIIIGGGYIGVEYGHFFAAMGTRVTILEMADRLVLAEEPEVSDLLRKELSKRGFHIIGPHAPILIQEVINAMTSRGHLDEIHKGIHIHPALPELIPVTLNSLEQ
jgi:pyruvate/2-oxoglutarate dehydrogenase complex dihydrolipoamide dehydrogenase (E3) component